MIKNNLKIISEYLNLEHPVTDISNALGWSKGQVSQYYNDKIEMSANFRNTFANHYKIKFSDFEEPPKEAYSNNQPNPTHMRELLNEKERMIQQMQLSISLLQDKIKHLERENFFSTQPLPERNESEEDKRAR